MHSNLGTNGSPKSPAQKLPPWSQNISAALPSIPNDSPRSDETPLESEKSLGFAEHVVAKSSIPSQTEIADYLAISKKIATSTKVSSQELVDSTRAAFEMRSRLSGDSGSGGIALLELRQGWAKQVAEALPQITTSIEMMYQEAPSKVIEAIANDFLSRINERAPNLAEPHSASAISSCLEQTRLMVIFAGRALKSEDHVQSALSGLQERSFVSDGSQTPAANAKEKSAEDRRSSFESRQAQKAAQSAAKKAALQAGQALPVKDAPPPIVKDDEKSELLASTAAQHRGNFDDARPSDQQKHLLRQRGQKELERTLADRLRSPKGAEREKELETTRIELTNVLATRLKDWFSTEIQLGKHLGKSAIGPADISKDVHSANARRAEIETHLSAIKALHQQIEADLRRSARVAETHKDKLVGAFSLQEFKLLDEILNPPKPKETFELAD